MINMKSLIKQSAFLYFLGAILLSCGSVSRSQEAKNKQKADTVTKEFLDYNDTYPETTDKFKNGIDVTEALKHVG